MIITKLELENWMRIRKLVLKFSKDINLIYGPNEIGKSSIIEAIKLALLGDTGSERKDYKNLQPWGTNVKAKVDLFFTTREGKNYRVSKSFPRGNADLYLSTVKLSEDARNTQRKLYEILELSEKTTKLIDLLFINQGETLNIFSPQKNQNPMNENTKSYIKDVIKETAFKSLQEFQNFLNRERDVLFTNPEMRRFKSGAKAPEYIRLVEKEKELKVQVAELEEKVAEFSQRLEEMEALDKNINLWAEEKKKREKLFADLKAKDTKLAELEKKKLEFKPVQQDYKRFLDIEDQLSVLNRELPGLYTLGKKEIARLEADINSGKAKQKEIRHYQTALKLKKKECERAADFKQRFDSLEKEYREIQRIDKSIEENDKLLPVLFVLNREKLEEKSREIQSKIDDYLKKKAGLKAVDEQLKKYPKMTKKDVALIKKISMEISKIEAKLEGARSALKMKFKITPHQSKEIRFNLKIDDGEPVSHTTAAPIEAVDFQRLSFQYPDEFDIDVSGRPAEVDIEALQEAHRGKQVQLTQHLNQMKVKIIEELDNKFQEYIDLKSRIKEIQDLMGQMIPFKDINRQKKEIKAYLVSLEQDIKKYLGKDANPNNIRQDEAAGKRKQSFQSPRDELTKVKANKDNLTAQLEAILKGRTFEAFEKEYKDKAKEYAELRETVSQMEPKAIKEVTQNHLDEVEEKLKALDKKTAETEKDKTLLESMPGGLEFQVEGIEPPSGPKQSPQETRDAIHEKRTQLKELDKQRNEILDGRKKENFKKEYLLKKDEIDILGKCISGMAPVESNTLKDVRAGLETLEKGIKSIAGEMENSRSRKARLSGEIDGFGMVMEEKNQVEYSYGKVLENIKTQLTDIYALKLLLKLIEEEKEKVQQEIFKPLEQRVIRSFNRLIPGKYKLDIDNNLSIRISGRTLTGDFQEGIDDFLSYGTKEQLSFLLRLAIAEQLSQKEPQLMILDDSFVNTDTNRLPQLLEMIEESSKEVQFLIFTCKENDYLQYKEKLNTINLEEAM